MSGDPLHYYVRDKGSAFAHHWDYARSRPDHALCGYPYQSPVWEGEARPRAVCRACQALLAPHEARWWRKKAEALQAEVEALTIRIAVLKQGAAVQRKEMRRRKANPPKSKVIQPDNSKPDNSKEAVARRVRETSPNLMSAADIPSRWPRPSGRNVRVVSGGLPGLGQRR